MDRETGRLIGLLASPHEEIRHNSVTVLANIGPPAIRQLLHALRDDRPIVRQGAATALFNMGEALTLPRLVLADARLSAHERARTLEALRAAKYSEGRRQLAWPLPEIHRYCQQMRDDPDAAVCQGAELVLAELHRHTLLRPGQRNETSEPEELLRPATSASRPDNPATLLRSVPDEEPPPLPKRTSLLARLRRFDR